jgi:ABC-type transporter Mla subunit MlaD
MSFATLANLATMIFCGAVLVQSIRMMRSIQTVKDGALSKVVEALDNSTAQARDVLSEMKSTLNQYARHEHHVTRGREIADELGVMIGIANATAERLAETASAANRVTALEPDSQEQVDRCEMAANAATPAIDAVPIKLPLHPEGSSPGQAMARAAA